MLSSEFIETEKKNLNALGDQLHKESLFARQFIDSGKRPSIEVSWFKSILSISTYSTFLIRNLIDNFESYQDKPEEQISFYIGKIAIQSFLEIINAFELSTNGLIENNESISKLLNERIDKKIALIEESWRLDVNSKSKKLKKDLINGCKRKRMEMKFIRDTLHQHKIINELDVRILEFSWDIRNSMHTNFVAIKDIEFSAPGTNLNYSFKFEKGQELYHPKDLLSFYSMTEQIIFIQLRTLQYFNKENKSDSQ